MRRMPLIEDRIKIGRCYGMTIGGKLIVARVIQIYPLDIGVRKNPVKENVVRWAWRDAAGSGKWTESPGWLLPAFAFAADDEMACDSFNFEQS
jgi:hypothetical protein